MSGRRGVAVLLGLAVAAWGLWTWLPGEERRIARRLRSLAEEASLPSGEDRLMRMARAGRIGRYFTEGVTLDLGDPYQPMTGRERIVGFVASLPVSDEAMRAELVDLQVWVGADGASATASTTARVTGAGLVAPGGQGGDVREFELGLVKAGGEWLINRVQIIRALQSPVR